jgi:hypothetical protein
MSFMRRFWRTGAKQIGAGLGLGAASAIVILGISTHAPEAARPAASNMHVGDTETWAPPATTLSTEKAVPQVKAPHK